MKFQCIRRLRYSFSFPIVSASQFYLLPWIQDTKIPLFALCGTGCEAAYHQMALLVREPVYHDPRIGCSLTHFLQLDTDGSCMWAPHCALRPFSFCLVYLCFSTFFNLVFQKGAEFHRKLQTRFLCVAVQKAELSLCVFQNIIKWRKFFSRKLL